MRRPKVRAALMKNRWREEGKWLVTAVGAWPKVEDAVGGFQETELGKVRKVHGDKWRNGIFSTSALPALTEEMKAGGWVEGQTSKRLNQRKISTGMEEMENRKWNIGTERKQKYQTESEFFDFFSEQTTISWRRHIWKQL